jgi:hypothetical protein
MSNRGGCWRKSPWGKTPVVHYEPDGHRECLRTKQAAPVDVKATTPVEEPDDEVPSKPVDDDADDLE